MGLTTLRALLAADLDYLVNQAADPQAAADRLRSEMDCALEQAVADTGDEIVELKRTLARWEFVRRQAALLIEATKPTTPTYDPLSSPERCMRLELCDIIAALCRERALAQMESVAKAILARSELKNRCRELDTRREYPNWQARASASPSVAVQTPGTAPLMTFPFANPTSLGSD